MEFGLGASSPSRIISSVHLKIGGHLNPTLKTHRLSVSEEEWLRRLLSRNASRPEGLYFASTTEEGFRSICKYFQAPHPDEGMTFTTYR